MQLDKKSIKEKYDELNPLYTRLGSNIKKVLVEFLLAEHVEFIDVYCRIKKFDSFWTKTSKKGHDNPFEQVHDVCGLRIINYYESDEQIIETIIAKEFKIYKSEDKKERLALDQFGYRSKHYVVELPVEWLKAPNYRGLEGIKFEIQSRTILMHAWATISHKLSYKKEDDIPAEFRRSLFRLSALVELADQQFDILRVQQKNYMESLIKESPAGELKFDLSAPLNVDSLKALLSIICPDREWLKNETADLVEEIRSVGVELSDIYEGHQKIKNHIPEMERESFESMEEIFEPEKSHWSLGGFVRNILDITFDLYWRKRVMNNEIPKKLIPVRNKWKKIIQKQERA